LSHKVTESPNTESLSPRNKSKARSSPRSVLTNNKKNWSQIASGSIAKDELAKGKEISIKAFQLPVLNSAVLEQDLEVNITLSELFEDTKQELKMAIKEVFNQEL